MLSFILLAHLRRTWSSPVEWILEEYYSIFKVVGRVVCIRGNNTSILNYEWRDLSPRERKMTLDKPGARCEMYESENTFVQTLFSRLHVATVPSSPVDHMSPELQHLNYTSEPSQIFKSCKTHKKNTSFPWKVKHPQWDTTHHTPCLSSSVESLELLQHTTTQQQTTSALTDRSLFCITQRTLQPGCHSSDTPLLTPTVSCLRGNQNKRDHSVAEAK